MVVERLRRNGRAILGVWRSFFFVALACGLIWACVRTDALRSAATAIGLVA